MLAFKAAGFTLLYALLRLQDVLPLNPAGQPAVPPDLAFNTAVSFLTNTNWQSYGGETTMSYFSQMAGLTVQNFVSAAAGIAIAFAFVRGFARRSAKTIGNYWADLVRITLYVLLPASIVIALVFVWQGVPQTLGPYVDGDHAGRARSRPSPSARSPRRRRSRCSAPMAAASSTPTRRTRSRTRPPLTNLIQMLSIFTLGAGLTAMFGRMVGDKRQGWAVFAAMGLLFLAGVAVAYWSEAQGNPLLTALGVDPVARQHGGQGGALRRAALARCSPPSPPTPPAAR